MAIQPGTRFGPYEIGSLLGAGGMGEVYAAHDPRLGREVAVKVLPQEFTADPDRLRRFEQEARAASMLNHPNVVTVYDIGSENATVYVVSELLVGETLRERLREGSLSLRKVIEYSLQIMRGLAAAHDKGIVHRDLKPENIFIMQDGRVKILDFGLAKLTAPEAVSGQHSALQTVDPGTRPGMMLGTAGYMSPEQVRGKTVDHRSDIFSFGAILYEMLSGKRAFQGDSSADLITAILREEPPELALSGIQINPGLQRVIRHCLEKNPEERFQSARDLAFDLEMVSGISETTASTTLPAGTQKAKAFSKLLLPFALLSMLAIGVAIGKYLLASRSSVAESAYPKVNFKKLTDVPGVEFGPSLSPDGKSFVYGKTQSGNSDIFLARVGGRNPINLTQNSLAEDYQPAFSPSGDEIAFRSDRDGGGIYVMGATGESVRRLTDFGYYPSWSPKGKEIVFSTVNNDPLHAGENGKLWAVNAQDGKKKLIYEGEDANTPRWSPHGERIAFWGLKGNTGQRDIWTVGASGKDVVSVTDDAPVDWNPVWSPDGKYLYFLSDRSGSMNLHRVAIDEHTGKILGEPESVITPSPWIADISFAADSNELIYAAFDQRSEIQKVSFDPVQEKIISAPQEITSSTDSLDEGQVSTDGNWLTLFTVWPQQDIYVIGTNGSEKRKLTDDLYRDRYPSWSPDGKSIVFMSDRSGGYEFWMIERDGSDLRQVTNNSLGAWNPKFSPDGKWLMVNNENGTHLYNTSDRLPWNKSFLLPKVPSHADNPFAGKSWSPDNMKIAGALFTPSNLLLIYWMETRDYKAIPMPAGVLLNENSMVGWFSDNRRILMLAGSEFYIIDTESNTVRKIEVPGEGVSWARITVDDHTLYSQHNESQSDIWMLSLNRKNP